MKLLALVAATIMAGAAVFGTPILQVRDDPKSPFVGILAWDANQPEFGLRTRVDRNGKHLGEGRAGEHRLFINTAHVEANGAFNTAVAHTGKVLRKEATVRDVDACRFNNVCAPQSTLGLAIADDVLRANRDSFVVTLRVPASRPWTVRLDKNVIEAYLNTVDSVSAALKK